MSSSNDCHCRYVTCKDIHDYSSSECSYKIKEQPCAACTELAEIDAEISRLQDSLYRLVLKRRHVKRKINDAHDILTRHLPPELQMKIFDHFAESEPYRSFNLRSTFRKDSILPWLPPVLLGAVCKNWREITLVSPRLWTQLNYDPSFVYQAVQYELVEEWLKRSFPLPISIKLCSQQESRFSMDRSTSRIIEFESLFNTLKPHSSRWGELELHIPYLTYSALFCDIELLPSLKIMKLNIPGGLSYHSRHPFRLPTAPSLEELTMNNVPVKDVELDWENIKTLHIMNYSNSVTFETVKLCKHLKSLRLSMITLGENEDFSICPLTHQSLTRLEVELRSGELLEKLTMPNLTDFDFSFFPSRDAEILPLTILSEFLSRSPAIKTFRLSTRMEYINHFKVLDNLPTITHLHLIDVEGECYPENSSKIAEYLFASLGTPSTDRGGKLFLPCLQYLKFESTPKVIESKNWDSFADIFGSRRPKNHESSESLQNSENNTDKNHLHFGHENRPLQEVSVVLCKEEDYTTFYPKRSTALRLLEIERSGIVLDIRDVAGKDLLHRDLNYFGDDY